MNLLQFISLFKSLTCIWEEQNAYHSASHKPLEPFLSKGVKIPKLDWLAMELADYNITFVHIKDSNSILAEAISRLEMLDVYRDHIEDPKVHQDSDPQQHVTEVNINKIHILNSNVLHIEQNWDITCKKQLCNHILVKKYLQHSSNFCEWHST